jgi:DNA polymerase (family 10)
VDNQQLARIFTDIADLLDIKGENRFRILSYRRAAETIANLPEEMTAVVAQGRDPAEFPGIGEAISKKILEALQTGKVPFLENLKQELPASLLGLLEVRGVGPKAVKAVYEKLGVTTLDQLQAAAEGDRLSKLPGFGKRSQEKILEAIRDLRSHSGRFKLSEALATAEQLTAYLGQVKGIGQMVPAGSLRRWRETVGDLDILITCADPGPVMDRFVGYPGVREVVGKGETKSTVILTSGMQVDVRVLPEESFGSALCYFTGSKDHNVALREMAKKEGLKLSEYGLFRPSTASAREAGGRAELVEARDDALVAGRTEEEVYQALALPCIPPELREDRGEIEAARARTLPRLIELKDIKADLQVHTNWSDGTASIEEMARAAKALGYRTVAITDHSQAVRVANGLDAKRVREQKTEIEAVRKKVRGITILHGIEVDILSDGSLDLPVALLRQLDIVIGAVHSRFEMPRDAMTARILKAVSTGLLHVFGHPTGRLINRRPAYQVDLEALFAAAREHRVALELNAHPDRLDLTDIYVKRAKELGLTITINTDAHSLADLELMKFGVFTARRGWLEKTDVLNTKSPTALQTWLRRGPT